MQSAIQKNLNFNIKPLKELIVLSQEKLTNG